MTFIKEFYSGCDVFITGGTGFMGKVLIEKLARSCPDIGNIYVLVRNRKDKDIHTRIKDMLDLPLFEKLRSENPGVIEKKLIPVMGNITETRMELSDEDYEMLIEKISIVFHVAATVKFDESIRDAIIKNVKSTREVVLLGKQMKNLKVFLHVSTTYCNCTRVYVEEKIYESPISWEDAIAIAENIDPKLSEICTTKLMGSFPNTYTFSKLLAEQIINDESANMPMVIFRPSIVISTLDEPIPGWIDNLNGPIGLMTACGKGLSLVTLAHKDMKPDFIAVDLSIKAMIIAAYHRGTHNSSLDNKLPIYNCSAAKKSINNNEIMQLAVKHYMLNPYDEILWRPRVLVTSSLFLYYILTILQQVLPAMLITSLTNIIGKPQPINLMNLQRKIYLATIALSTFTCQSWTFVNINFMSLLNYIPTSEKTDFDFSFDNVSQDIFFGICVVGSQKYLFHSNPKNNAQTKKKLKILVWMDRILRSLFFLLMAWCLEKIVYLFKSRNM